MVAIQSGRKNVDEQIVVLFPYESKVDAVADLHELPDPFTNAPRSYWVYKHLANNSSTNEGTNTIYEINKIHGDEQHASLWIGNNVLSSNTLHTATPVDPLFWLVFFCSTSSNNTSTSSWQPLEQLLQTACGNSYYALLSSCLDRNQCSHILETLSMGDDDDVYYKFSWDKTLLWLSRKQEQVLNTLTQQRKNACATTTDTGGAFCAGFVLPKRHEKATPASCSSTMHPEDRASSYQIVGNYLSEATRERWSEHLGSESSELWGDTTATPRSTKKLKVANAGRDDDWNSFVANGCVENASGVKSNSDNNKGTSAPMTAGAKRLQKASTRGIKKISSFFSASKPKKTKTTISG